MMTLPVRAPIVKPARPGNPRDSWPDWTDAGRWALGPGEDGPRPTAGPEFEPDAEDDAEWLALKLAGASRPCPCPITDLDVHPRGVC